jgi:predicted MPP superfamily phosphohydrolase
MLFTTCVILTGVFDVLWWRLGSRRLRAAGVGRFWRWAFAAFMTLQLGTYLTIIAFRKAHAEPPLPGTLLVLVYTWHIFVLPVWMVLWTVAGAIPLLGRARFLPAWRTRNDNILPRPAVSTNPQAVAGHDRAAPTRRDLFRAGIAGIPPIAGLCTAAGALRQQELFEVIRMEVPVAGLPPELDGLRIAHVSDTHVGKFTSNAKLRAITLAVNDLDVDLVAFTGDLIDHWMGALPDGMALIRSFRSRYGTFVVEGNHDLMDDRVGFRWEMQRAGLNLLLNQATTLRIRGQQTQILGIRWGAEGFREPLFEEHFAATLPLRDPAAFPILLSHHPHTFDPATVAGLPLVLCGHTHGGQLMLTREIGPARLMYKYLSGLYRRGRTSLVVSNGVGNWFPLRINAPAQMAELTLRRETA